MRVLSHPAFYGMPDAAPLEAATQIPVSRSKLFLFITFLFGLLSWHYQTRNVVATIEVYGLR